MKRQLATTLSSEEPWRVVSFLHTAKVEATHAGFGIWYLESNDKGELAQVQDRMLLQVFQWLFATEVQDSVASKIFEQGGDADWIIAEEARELWKHCRVVVAHEEHGEQA